MRRRWAIFCILAIMTALVAGCAMPSSFAPSEEQAQAHYGRAMAYRDAGNLPAAIEQLQYAVDADNSMYHAWYMLGLAYHEAGQDERAAWAWKMGLAQAAEGPDRDDYPRQRAQAAMQAALTALGGVGSAGGAMATETESPGEPTPPPPPPPAPAPEISPALKPSVTVKGANNAPKTLGRPSAGSAQATSASGGSYAVLFSSNRYQRTAQSDQAMLRKRGFTAEVREYKDKKGATWYRVWVGCCQDQAKASRLAQEIKTKTGRTDVAVMKLK